MDNNYCLIDYSTFKKCIISIKDMVSNENELCGSTYMPRNQSTSILSAISLLETIMHDENQWISYWIYALKCGEVEGHGCVIGHDGNKLSLKTTEDLWNILVTEKTEDDYDENQGSSKRFI